MADVLYSASKNEGAYKNGRLLETLSDSIRLEDSIFAFNHDLLCSNPIFDRKIIEDLLNHIRSARIIGAASLDIINVAEGRINGYISNGLSPWDVAGSYVILREVGGVATRNDGQEINMLENGTVVACNGKIHDKVIDKYLKYWYK